MGGSSRHTAAVCDVLFNLAGARELKFYTPSLPHSRAETQGDHRGFGTGELLRIEASAFEPRLPGHLCARTSCHVHRLRHRRNRERATTDRYQHIVPHDDPPKGGEPIVPAVRELLGHEQNVTLRPIISSEASMRLRNSAVGSLAWAWQPVAPNVDLVYLGGLAFRRNVQDVTVVYGLEATSVQAVRRHL